MGNQCHDHAHSSLQLKMRTGGVDPSRMWRKKRSPKPKQKKAKQPTTLQNVSPVLHDTHEKVPVPVSISEEMIGDNREGDKRTELSKEDEEMAISKDLAEEVDKVNEQVSTVNFLENCIQFFFPVLK